MNMTARDIWQQEAIDTWWATKRGTVCLPTGVGKTKVGVDIVKLMATTNKNLSVLIVVPTINLKENEWTNEFQQWYDLVPTFVDIECINTAYKISKHYDLLIVDEIHKTLSPEFIHLYTNITYNALLGLTATPPDHREDYMESLDKICPVVYQRTLNEAVQEGILSDFLVYNLPVTLTKKESFLYKRYNALFEGSKELIWRNIYKEGLSTSKNIFDVASEHRLKPDSLLYKASKQFWTSMTLRKWVCYNAERKVERCLEIIQAFPGRRWIIFSTSTKFVDALHAKLSETSRPFHSKMNKRLRDKSLEEFATNPNVNVLISALALIQGYNLPSITGAICASGTSVELTNIQSLGRILRKADGKTDALFINLYAENTQEEIWVKKKTVELINVKWIRNVSSIQAG